MFESLRVRDLRVYAQAVGGNVLHYRGATGLEVDAIVELPDGRWAAFEIKLGGQAGIEDAARNLHSLEGKVSPERVASMVSLNVLTAGTPSYTRADGINVLSIGHLAV